MSGVTDPPLSFKMRKFSSLAFFTAKSFMLLLFVMMAKGRMMKNRRWLIIVRTTAPLDPLMILGTTASLATWAAKANVMTSDTGVDLLQAQLSERSLLFIVLIFTTASMVR